jgi:hypothetical protein
MWVGAATRLSGSQNAAYYSRNGIVDAADYTLWRDTLCAVVTPYSGADGSGNGVVDMADYDLWKTHFGQTLSGSGSAAALVATAPLKSVAANDPFTAAPVADATLASSTAPNSFRAEFGAEKPLQVTVPRILSDTSVTAVRQDNALLAWLASRQEGQRRQDDVEAVGFVDDRAAVESTDSRFDAVDELFDALSTMPAVASHQLVSA